MRLMRHPLFRDAHGTVVATVAVSGPSFRITPDRYDDIAAKVVAAAAQLSGDRKRHV